MHIAIVAAYWYYPEVAYQFPLRLVKEGHKVTAVLWSPNASGNTRQTITSGFTVYKVRGINPFVAIDSYYKYPYMFGLPRIIAGLEPQIIDCQSHLFLTTVQAVKAAIKLDIPSVVTVHGVMARRKPVMNLAQSIYLYTLGSWLFKKATIIRCLTKNDAQEIMSYGCPPEKVRIIPHAVDTGLFRPKNMEEEEKEYPIAWVGRFVHEKGLEHLLEAARIVVSYRKDVKFRLIGDGPLKKKIARIADRQALSNNIDFTGAVAHTKLARLLQEATLFALPSLKEGMPFALLEAMACGKPVIGSDISGVNDIVTHGRTGVLVPPGNSEALANAILRLLSDKNLRRKMSRKARQLMVEKYNWNTIISMIEKVYYEAMEECKHSETDIK